MPVFVLDRREEAGRRVPTASVVEGLDVVEECRPETGMRLKWRPWTGPDSSVPKKRYIGALSSQLPLRLVDATIPWRRSSV